MKSIKIKSEFVSSKTIVDLKKQANIIRKDILNMIIEAGGGHIAPALSNC